MHRDLKPSNVILARDGVRRVPRIVDFGLAKAIDIELDNATRSGAMMGTLEYMAPEQIVDSKNVDGRADLYSVAAMLYEALVGTTPYSGANLVERHSRAVADDYLDLASLRPDLEPRMIEAVTAGLRGKVEDRVASARALQALWVGNPPKALPEDAVLWGGEPASPPPERTLVPPAVVAATMPEWTSSAPSRPQVPTAAPAEASVRRRSGAPWVALGALALGLLFVGWRILVRADPAPAPRVVIPEVVAEAAPPVPEPAVVRDTPPPEARPEPVPEKRVAKPKAPIAEALAAPPPPEKKPAAGPNVTIDGVERSYLRDTSGKTWLLPASVPSGRYQLYVFWDPDKATATKIVTVDGAVTIHCVPNLRMCQ